MKKNVLIVGVVLFFIFVVSALWHLRPGGNAESDFFASNRLRNQFPIAANREDIKKQVTLQFFGDIMLDRDVARAMGKNNLDYIFAKGTSSSSVFITADLTIANLEGPFAPSRVPTSKSIAFRFDPKLAAQLRGYGFDGFNLANNHSYDMGRQNLVFTRNTLEENNLFYFGDEYSQGPEYTYIAGEKEGLPFTIAFVGFNDTEHSLSLEKVKMVIADAKSKAKFVIVNIHWGEEYQQHSNMRQQTLAHQIIDWGADAIIGHHPHVVQEMEVYNDKLIFYSLGNFIFDQYFSKPTQEGISVGLTMSEDGKIDWTALPFFSKKSQVQLMSGAQRDVFMEWFEQNSRMR